MKIIKGILIIWLFFSISCCVNQQKKDEEQIKETVQKFWIAVQNNNEAGYLSLIEDSSGEYKIAMLNQLHYLNRNYSEIKNIVHSKEIQIKDTNELGGSQKYVEYSFTKSNSMVEPLSLKLFFYKPVGYNKIFNIQILGNLPKWEKKEL